MNYLLDVNALIALGCTRHVHHQRVRYWLLSLADDEEMRLATCSITELGFLRIAGGHAALLGDLITAQQELRQLKTSPKFIFLADGLSAEQMPEWVKQSKQTTDGHLLELAAGHRARLATLDTGIPGAEFIPEWIGTGLMVREERLSYGIAA